MKTEFNLEQYILEFPKEQIPPEEIHPEEISSEEISPEEIVEREIRKWIINYLKTKIESDYDYCKLLYETYSNFIYIIDTVEADIFSKPQKEFYAKAKEEETYESYKNSRNVDEQALYWMHFISTEAKDKKQSEQEIYEIQYWVLQDSETDDEVFLNILKQGLNKAATFLGLELIEDSKNKTTESLESNASALESAGLTTGVGEVPLTGGAGSGLISGAGTVIGVAVGGAAAIGAAVVGGIMGSKDSNSIETGVKDSENSLSGGQKYLIKSDNINGLFVKTVYWLYPEFTSNYISNSLSETLLDNWKLCTYDPVGDTTPKPEEKVSSEQDLNKDVIKALTGAIVTKLIKDIKDDCQAVTDDCRINSDENRTIGEL